MENLNSARAGRHRITLRLHTIRIAVLAVFVALLTARSLSADQIASNINGTDVGFWGINEGFWSGVSVTTDNRPWTLDSVVTPVSQDASRSQSGIFIQLYSNNAGQPGAPLGSKLRTPNVPPSVANTTFTPVGAAPTLAPSTTYWVVLGVDDPASNANPIYRRTTLTPGEGPGTMPLTIWSSENDGLTWAFQSPSDANQSIRMQINGTVIPEPASAALVALGLAALAIRRSR